VKISPQKGQTMVFIDNIGKYNRIMVLEEVGHVRRIDQSGVRRTGCDISVSTRGLFHYAGRFTTSGYRLSNANANADNRRSIEQPVCLIVENDVPKKLFNDVFVFCIRIARLNAGSIVEKNDISGIAIGSGVR
jgi:hypothetical protein